MGYCHMSVPQYNVTVRNHPVFLCMFSYDLFLKVLIMFRWKHNIYCMYKTNQQNSILSPSSQLIKKLLVALKETIYFLGEQLKNGEIPWVPVSILPSSFTICLLQTGQKFYFIFPKKLFCILKWVLIEYKIIMIKSRVTGIVFPLSHKNSMTISTWDSLSTNLEKVLALSKILLVDGHIIIIPLTPDTVPTPGLFYYGKYWKNLEQAVWRRQWFAV